MSCEELKDLYELYALGALETADRREIEEHLQRNCPNCVPGVKRARQLNAAMALAAPDVEPPARLRERVLVAVSPERQKASGGAWSWLTHAWASAALVMLIAVVWYASHTRGLQMQVAEMNRSLNDARLLSTDLEARNRLLADAITVLNLPDSRQLVFGTTGREPPRGRVFLHPQRGVVLLASRLPAAPAGKVYEMWLLPKKGAPVPAGLFNANERGEATHVWNQQLELLSIGGVAVSIEPAGGVQAPTGDIVIVAKMS